ncbi:MAG: biotin--[acetyl-CoA-carboxylase] ligase [Candidatus Aminicenantes bacterium RBG_13_62_12]|nr:MAG: biotin--[acetyl-CoA-carboxylase] ligase [Candidatus Aminicenantes bacterium RBG_13_62_12]
MSIGAKILNFESCPSTNDLARNLAEHGETEGLVVVAAEQTAGRGTRGRSWFSPKEKGLYLSVLFRPPSEAVSFLPLAAGLAVREALSLACGLKAELRWPNDIIAAGRPDRKLGGILSESQWTGTNLDFAVVGVGLNLRHKTEDFSFNLRTQAVSVQMLTGRPPDEPLLLEQLLARMDFWYGLIRRGERHDILTEYRKRMFVPPGGKMTIIHGQGRAAGRFEGLGEDGGLILATPEGNRIFKAAEIMGVIYEKK